jgi:hypothetical protein
MITRADIVPGLFFTSSDNDDICRIVRVYDMPDGWFKLGCSYSKTNWCDTEGCWTVSYHIVEGKIIGRCYPSYTPYHNSNMPTPDDIHCDQIWIVEPEPHMITAQHGQLGFAL